MEKELLREDHFYAVIINGNRTVIRYDDSDSVFIIGTDERFNINDIDRILFHIF